MRDDDTFASACERVQAAWWNLVAEILAVPPCSWIRRLLEWWADREAR
jgi:hypothetical protein